MITLTATLEVENATTEDFEVLFELNKGNVLSLNRSITDRSNLQLPSWGIISNAGNATFVDKSGELLHLINSGILNDKTKVNFYLNNTLAPYGKPQNVGTFYASDWEYDNDSREVTIFLTDDLEEWQDILVYSLSYDPRKEQKTTLKEVYEQLYSITPTKYNLLAFEGLDIPTQSVLQNSHIQYNIINAKNLWSAWDLLCQACQLHIYKDNDGITICRYNGGN